MNLTEICSACGGILREDGICPGCFVQVVLEDVLFPPVSPASLNDTPTDKPLTNPPAPVRRKINQYEIVELLGRGGMGVVYRSWDTTLKRPVAIKMLRAEGPTTEEDLQRFQMEAEAIARLQHPGIVQIYEIGTSDDQPFLALEYVEGGSLDAHLDGEPWYCSRAVTLMMALANSVHAAHKAGVIHRDLKPGNVLLSGEELEPKISDFGLARITDNAQDQTRSGTIKGTPAYCAPEQALGKVKTIGPRTDVHALGAILYELLTGHPPFCGASLLETLHLVATQDPVDPHVLSSAVPRDLGIICLKCLEKDPDRRYESAKALADDLRQFENGEPILARPVTRLEKAGKWIRRNPVLTGLLTALIVVLVSGSTVAISYALLANQRADRLNRQNSELKEANERERKAANLARQQSEQMLSMMETMILDVSTKLASIPAAQPARRKILQRGLDALKLLSADIKKLPRAQQNHYRAVLQLARIYEGLGNSEGLNASSLAIEHFQLAVNICDRSLAQNPNDLQAMLALGDALEGLGNSEFDSGHPARSGKPFERCLTVRQRIFAFAGQRGTPEERLVHRLNVITAYRNWGDYLTFREKLEQAIGAYQSSIRLAEDLTQEIRNDRTLSVLATGQERLGDLYLDYKKYDLAGPVYREALRDAQEALKLNPTPLLHWDLASVWERVGELHFYQKEYREALAAYEKSLVHSWPMIDHDPDRLEYKLGLAISYCKLGKTHYHLNNPDGTVENYQKALSIRLPVTELDPNHVTTQRLVLDSYRMLGLAYEKKHDWENALKQYQTGLSFFKSRTPEVQKKLQRYEESFHKLVADGSAKSQQ